MECHSASEVVAATPSNQRDVMKVILVVYFLLSFQRYVSFCIEPNHTLLGVVLSSEIRQLIFNESCANHKNLPSANHNASN